MKIYKDRADNIFAYEEGQVVGENLVLLSDEDSAKYLHVAGPPRVPTMVSRRQGRLALIEVGRLQDVETYLNAIPDETERLRAHVEYETEIWERSNPWVSHVLSLLKLTPEEADDLFRLAASF